MSDEERCDRCGHVFDHYEHAHALAWTGETICCPCSLSDPHLPYCAIRMAQAEAAGVTNVTRLLRIARGEEEMPQTGRGAQDR